MKTVGQILDKLDECIERYAGLALNPDRASFIREQEIIRREELVHLRKFIIDDGTAD